MLGYGILNTETWPKYDEKLCVEDEVEIVVQICGKVKAKLMIPMGAAEDVVVPMALEQEAVRAALEGKTIRKQIYIQNKLVNFVAN